MEIHYERRNGAVVLGHPIHDYVTIILHLNNLYKIKLTPQKINDSGVDIMQGAYSQWRIWGEGGLRLPPPPLV